MKLVWYPEEVIQTLLPDRAGCVCTPSTGQGSRGGLNHWTPSLNPELYKTTVFFFFFSKSSWSRNSPLRGGFSAASLRGWKESQARVTVLSFILTFLFGLGGFSGRHRKIGRLSKSSWCVGNNNNNNNNMSATHTLLKNLGCDHWVSESLVWPRHAKEKGAVLERLCYVTLAWEADRCLQHHHCMQTL